MTTVSGLHAARGIARVALLAALFALAPDVTHAQHDEPTATGAARVRQGARETRFHLLIHGHAVSLSVETGRCRRRAECESTWHFRFEGVLDAATPEIVASFRRAQSRAARPPEPVPMEPSTARLVCRRPLTLGTTQIAGRCRLIGPLPPAWRDLPRASCAAATDPACRRRRRCRALHRRC